VQRFPLQRSRVSTVCRAGPFCRAVASAPADMLLIRVLPERTAPRGAIAGVDKTMDRATTSSSSTRRRHPQAAHALPGKGGCAATPWATAAPCGRRWTAAPTTRRARPHAAGDDGLTCAASCAKSDIPVVMLTARRLRDPPHRRPGDGRRRHLPKPFSARELLARIKVILRRTRSLRRTCTQDEHLMRFAGWTLDTARRLARLAGRRGDGHRRRRIQAAALFLDHPNRVLDRDQLLDADQGREAEPPGPSIDVQVSRLRHRLGDDRRAAADARPCAAKATCVGAGGQGGHFEAGRGRRGTGRAARLAALLPRTPVRSPAAGAGQRPAGGAAAQRRHQAWPSATRLLSSSFGHAAGRSASPSRRLLDDLGEAERAACRRRVQGGRPRCCRCTRCR